MPIKRFRLIFNKLQNSDLLLFSEMNIRFWYKLHIFSNNIINNKTGNLVDGILERIVWRLAWRFRHHGEPV